MPEYKPLDISVLSVFEETDPALRWKKLVHDIRLNRSLPVILRILEELRANFPGDFKAFDIGLDPSFHWQETALRSGNWELVLWGPPARNPAIRERITLYHRGAGHALPGLWWEIDQHGRVFLGFVGATTGLSPSTHKALFREVWAKHREQVWEVLENLEMGFKSELKPGPITPGSLDEAFAIDSPQLARDPYFRKIYQITLLETTLADRKARSAYLPSLAAEFAVKVYPLLRLLQAHVKANVNKTRTLVSCFERATGKSVRQMGAERFEFSGLILSRVIGTTEFMLIAQPEERSAATLDRARDLGCRPVIRDTQAANATGTDGTLLLSWREARAQAFDLLVDRVEPDITDSQARQLVEKAREIMEKPREKHTGSPVFKEETYIPSNEMARAKHAFVQQGLLCVYGPPNSGKIRIANTIANRPHWIVIGSENIWARQSPLARFLRSANEEPAKVVHVGLVLRDERNLRDILLLCDNRNVSFDLDGAEDSVVVPPNIRFVLVCDRPPGLPLASLKAGPRPDVLKAFLDAESAMRPELRQKLVDFYAFLCQKIPLGQGVFMVRGTDQLEFNFHTMAVPVMERFLESTEVQEITSRFEALFKH